MARATRIGRYEVVDYLASGGMGYVYLARWLGPGTAWCSAIRRSSK